MEETKVPDIAPSPVQKRRRNIVAAVGIVVVVIAAVFLGLLLGPDDGGRDGGPNGLSPGDYYTYEMTQNGQLFSTVTYRIISVTEADMTLNMTFKTEGFDLTTYFEETVPIRETSVYISYVYDPPDGFAVQDSGLDQISTVWGSVAAHHYLVAFSFEGDQTSMDMWIYNDFLVLMTTVSENKTIEFGLTETNIDM